MLNGLLNSFDRMASLLCLLSLLYVRGKTAEKLLAISFVHESKINKSKNINDKNLIYLGAVLMLFHSAQDVDDLGVTGSFTRSTSIAYRR